MIKGFIQVKGVYSDDIKFDLLVRAADIVAVRSVKGYTEIVLANGESFPSLTTGLESIAVKIFNCLGEQGD